jgi:hypothetical protein
MIIFYEGGGSANPREDRKHLTSTPCPLEEPGHILAEGLHRLDAFGIVLNFSRGAPNPKIPEQPSF